MPGGPKKKVSMLDGLLEPGKWSSNYYYLDRGKANLNFEMFIFWFILLELYDGLKLNNTFKNPLKTIKNEVSNIGWVFLTEHV